MEETIFGESSETVEEILAEEDPKSYGPQLIVQFVLDLLAQYGWFLLLGSLGAYFIWAKYLQSEWKKWKEKYDEKAESARYHKDPDLALARIQAMENARQKMQEQYNAAASLYAEKLKEKEEAKRLEKIEDWDRHQKGLGYCGKTRVKEPEDTKSKGPKSKPSLRNNEYNPLMGSSGSSFRPPKRSVCGGGGCGGGGCS